MRKHANIVGSPLGEQFTLYGRGMAGANSFGGFDFVRLKAHLQQYSLWPLCPMLFDFSVSLNDSYWLRSDNFWFHNEANL